MNSIESSAERLLARCFTKQELEYLQTEPAFIEATRKMETGEKQLHALDVGQELIRAHSRLLAVHASHPATAPHLQM